MPISPLPTPPSRDDPTNFAQRADVFLGALPLFQQQANAVAAAAEAAAETAINAPGSAATSATEVPIGTGAKVFAIQTGKAFVVGQFVMVAETSAAGNYMHGQIAAHDPDAGSMTVIVTATGGGGTHADWTISLSMPSIALPLSGGNVTGPVDFAAPVGFHTPNDGTSGAVRIAANPNSGNAIIQFLTADGNGQLGYILLDGSGLPTLTGSRIWTAATDGAGSGLDADLLDGRQATDFLLTSATGVGGNWYVGGIVGAHTPNDGVTGGMRLYANDVTGLAYQQFLTAGGAHIGSLKVDGGATLEWSGTIRAAAVVGTSDARLKSNVRTIADPVVLVDRLRGVRFDWRQDGRSSLGVIAQELRDVVPELVDADEDGVLAVNYNGLVGVLIEAVKSLGRRVAVLEAAA